MPEKNQLLITGGTGFIGTRLALAGVDRGYTVAVLGQANTAAEEKNCTLLEQRGIALHLGAVTDTHLISQAVKGSDIVFHLAAAQHEANVPDQHFLDVNVEGTKNLIEACIKSGVRKFVHGSTIGVYGSAAKGEISSSSPLRPDNIYGKSKLQGEQLALTFADKLPLSVVRISETYGPGDRRLLKLFKAIDKRLFFIIGRGANKHQLIYVDDLIDGMFIVADSDYATGKVIILAGNQIITTREMAQTIANELGKSLRRFRTPIWPFLVAAVIMELTLKPFGIQPPLHRRRLDFFRKSFYFAHNDSHDKLGFASKIDFAEGVARTAKWYRANLDL